jgi:outer membrane protein
MGRARITHLGATLALLLHAGGTLAGSDCTAPAEECVAVGGWNFSLGLGVGDRTNPLAHGKDIPLVIIPQFSYYGKRVFIEDLDLGVTLADGTANTLNLIASPGYDRVFFYRTDLQNIFVGRVNSATPGAPAGNGNGNGQGTSQFPSRPRRVTYLAGPEWTFEYHGVSGQLDYLHEITGRNHGDEIRSALGIPLGQWAGSWKADLGVTWKSAAIVNYYYGSAGIYEAGSALNPFAKLSYSRPLGGKWRLTAFVHYEHLGNAIGDSPIVAQRHVTTAFFGATYEFHK